jgi:hypothetical protein
LIKTLNRIKKWYLKYFDWNDDGQVNWWEYFIPILLLIVVEVIAELIGIFITYTLLK